MVSQNTIARKGNVDAKSILGVVLAVSFLYAVFSQIVSFTNTTWLTSLGLPSYAVTIIALVSAFGLIYMVAKLFGLKI